MTDKEKNIPSITDLDLTDIRGINETVQMQIFEDLKGHGIKNCKDLATIDPKKLQDIKNVGPSSSIAIVAKAKALIGGGDDDEEEEEETKKTSSSATTKRFDKFALENLELHTMHGITEDSAKEIYQALRDAKIHDISILNQYDAEKLNDLKISGLGKARCKQIVDRCSKLSGGYHLDPATEIESMSENWALGCEVFDNILQGGIYIGTTTVVYGKYGLGKTLFCMLSVIGVFKPYQEVEIVDENGDPVVDYKSGEILTINIGGLVKEGEPMPEVFWLDTEDTFDKLLKKGAKYDKSSSGKVTLRHVRSRFQKLADAHGLDFERQVEPYIIISTARTPDKQVKAIQNAIKIASKRNIRLIVVDSLTKLFRAERGKEEIKMNQLAVNSQKLQYFFSLVLDLMNACPRGAAALYTNQVYQDIGANPRMVKYMGDQLTDVGYGGNAVYYNIDDQLHLYKRQGKMHVEVEDSSRLPKVDDVYDIDKEGTGFVVV